LTRSTLFVPGTRPDMMRKAAAGDADAVCLDLEDSVPPAEKGAARRHVVEALTSADFGARVRIVRINSIETAFAYRDLVDVVEQAGARIDLIMIPKVGAPRHVEFVDTLLTQIESSTGIGTRIGIEAQIETAAGFLYAREIASAAPRLDALIFGAGDYAASMHMPSAGIGERDEHDAAYPGDRWHAVMHTIVAAARVNGLRCMDGPYGAHTDTAGMERACRIARALGFDGKQCIHPSQVPVANAGFTPSDTELARAAGVVRAYEQAQADGRGAVAFEGRMIDAANLRMARTIVERRRLIDRA
jgi:citrate lyase subunit beta/citryl-CoA lyase